jgi:hypothetical protein
MSLAELKDNVMALPGSERHDFVVWLNRRDYGDIPGEALAELAAEVWDQDDRQAPRRAPKVTVTREGDTLCQKGCYPLALVFY